MPQVVFAALAGLTFGTGISLAVLTVVSYAIVIGAYYAYGTYAAGQARKAARSQFNSQLKDRLVMTATTDAPRSRVYGRVRNVDGIIFKATHGSLSEFYTFVVAIAGHEIDAVEQVYFGDEPLNLDGSGHVLNDPWRLQDKHSFSESAGTTAAGSKVLAHVPIAGSVQVVQRNPSSTDDQPAPLTSVSVVGSTVTWSGGVALWEVEIAYQYFVDTYNAKVTAFLGAPGQDLSGPLIALGIADVTSAHRFQGIACLLVTFTYNVDSFPQGVPGISAVMRGAKIYDPRTATTAWTRNAALIARDWSIYSGGGGAAAAELDGDILEDSANACDVSTVFDLDGNPLSAQPAFVCDLVAPTLTDPTETLQQIVMSMAGKYAWCGGKLRIKAGFYSAPVATIDETWLSGAASIDITSGIARQDLVNIFRPTISDKDQAYVPAPTKEIRAAAYITADGQELPRDLTLAAVTDVVHAQHVCGCMLRDARQALTVKLPCNLRAYPLEVFDTVAITLERFGWAAKEFEIISWEWSPVGGVLITAKETAAVIWDPASDFTTMDSAPNTTLPLPWVVPEPTGLTVSSGTAPLSDGSIVTRVLLEWDPTTIEAVRQSGFFEIQYTRLFDGIPPATEDWPTVRAPGSATSAILTGLVTNEQYLFRIRQINSIGVKSPWSDQRLHTVARPPSIIPDWTDITGRPTLYRAVARGQLDVGGPVLAGLYTGEANTPIDVAPVGGRRSYTVHAIRRSDGVYLGTSSFDVFGVGGDAAALAAHLNTWGNTVVIIVRGEHEPRNNRLDPAMAAAMYRCGASPAIFGSPEFKFRASYILVGIPGCGQGNGYEAYQGTVDDDPSAWCDVALSIIGGNFMIGGTTGSPRSIRDYSYSGTLDATTDLTLIARGNCVVAGNLGQKIGGASAWDSDIYTRDSAFGACFAQVTVVDVINHCMFGLNSDPTTDQSYTSLDYAIFISAGNLGRYESGAGTSIGTCVAGDVLTVLYDGAQVRYLKNGVLLIAPTPAAPNQVLFFDTSFLTPGASMRNMRFGILTDVSWQNIINVSVTTPQIAPNAATEIYTDTFDFAAAAFATATARTFSFTPAAACTIEVTGSLVGTNIIPDSGSSCTWWVTPASTGIAVPLPGAACPSVSTARTQFTFQGTYAGALAGDLLTFELKTVKLVGGAPNMVLGVSQLRLTQVKR